MCEIHKGIIVCSSRSVSHLQTSNEWLAARLKQIKEEEAAQAQSPRTTTEGA